MKKLIAGLIVAGLILAGCGKNGLPSGTKGKVIDKYYQAESCFMQMIPVGTTGVQTPIWHCDGPYWTVLLDVCEQRDSGTVCKSHKVRTSEDAFRKAQKGESWTVP